MQISHYFGPSGMIENMILSDVLCADRASDPGMEVYILAVGFLGHG